MSHRYKTVSLSKGREQSVHRKHPWIFSGGIKFKDEGILEGEIVHVLDFQKRCIATGIYHSGSIMVRILAFFDTLIDQKYWNDVISKAYHFRKYVLHLPSNYTNAYRLFNGEGDGVSGLIIDIYNTTAVVQCHNIGIHKMIDKIVEAIVIVMGTDIKTIYSKSKDSLGEENATIDADGCMYGLPIEQDKILENGHSFLVNWAEGQKTGFFLDQRDNRQLVGHYSSKKSVLNCFCYTGGFSVYAGLNNASMVHSVDISPKAMMLTEENIKINQVTNHHSFTANVMDHLKSENNKYDIVIVDPPAFAKSINKRHNAVQAYKRLNLLALNTVNKGGLLFTFSCSQVVNTQLFNDTIVAAGIESGRNIKVLYHLRQSADHAVNLFHPEGHYLKGLMLCVE